MSLTWSEVYFLSEWAIRLLMLFYVPQRRTPAAARSWLLLIFLLPWPGLVLYGILGRPYLPRKRREMQQLASHYIRGLQGKLEAKAVSVALPAHLTSASTLAARLGDFEMCHGNAVELLPDYEKSLQRLAEDIRGARKHAHVLTYIFEDDASGRMVAEALAEAAGRGVQCRVLMDAVGSKMGLKRVGPWLWDRGVEVVPMMPVGYFRRNAARYDLRNHRKIAVIDGDVGYVGSQNIVNPDFVPGKPNEELVARVRGPAVRQLQGVFCTDYYIETGKIINEAGYFPATEPCGDVMAQILPSGPGFNRANQQELLVALIHGAQRRVVLVTPYFIPDEPFSQAMCTAVDRGVQVDLILPKYSNQWFSHQAQESYYEELLEAGVSIHLYRNAFLHAKHVAVDDDVAIIGSTNIDIRSFALNAEVSMLFYDKGTVEQLHVLQDRLIAASDSLSARHWEGRPFWQKMVQNTARLADAVL